MITSRADRVPAVKSFEKRAAPPKVRTRQDDIHPTHEKNVWTFDSFHDCGKSQNTEDWVVNDAVLLRVSIGSVGYTLPGT